MSSVMSTMASVGANLGVVDVTAVSVRTCTGVIHSSSAYVSTGVQSEYRHIVSGLKLESTSVSYSSHFVSRCHACSEC